MCCESRNFESDTYQVILLVEFVGLLGRLHEEKVNLKLRVPRILCGKTSDEDELAWEHVPGMISLFDMKSLYKLNRFMRVGLIGQRR